MAQHTVNAVDEPDSHRLTLGQEVQHLIEKAISRRPFVSRMQDASAQSAAQNSSTNASSTSTNADSAAMNAGSAAINSASAAVATSFTVRNLPARVVFPHLEKWQRVVTVGDSVNEGLWDPVDTSLDMTTFENQSAHNETPLFGWTDRLAGHLSARRVEQGLSPVLYANLAIRGKLIRYIVEQEVPQALALKPDLVIMDGGGNDILRPGHSLDRIMAYIEHGVRQIRESGADVIYCLPNQPPSEEMNYIRGTTSDYATRLYELANKLDIYLCDTWAYPNLADPRLWSQDLIHPSPECHERLAQIALRGLGLDPDPAWQEQLDLPLPPAPLSLAARVKRNSSWIKEYSIPWIERRLKGVSSGDGRHAKRPYLMEMPASQPHPGSLLIASATNASASIDPTSPAYGPSAAGWVDLAAGDTEVTQKSTEALRTAQDGAATGASQAGVAAGAAPADEPTSATQGAKTAENLRAAAARDYFVDVTEGK